MSELTTEARVRYLEQLSQQLTQQMTVMKQLVATEVQDLKGVVQQQVAEIKQIVMHQDRVYQERIRRLEARVEQLSEFVLHVARSSGHVAGTGIAPLEIAAVEGSPRKLPDADDDEDRIQGVPGVIAKYKSQIDEIYDFYTTSHIDVFHSTMSLSHFTKFLKDCRLCGFEQAQPAELLWMTVLRRLSAQEGKRKGRNNKKENFAFERFEDIPKEKFGDALAILAQERAGKDRLDVLPEAVLETFLVCEVLPRVEPLLGARQSQPMMSREAAGALSMKEYQTESIQALFDQNMHLIRQACKESLRSSGQDYRDKTLDIDGFVELARRHDLLPLISKPDIRAIFDTVAGMENLRGSVKPGTLSRAAVVMALCHLADRIYGDRLLVDKYPTPESRVQKLLSKMFLLKPREALTDSWKKF